MAKKVNSEGTEKFRLTKVLREITPANTEKAHIHLAAARVMKIARRLAKEIDPRIKVMLVGSVPKNTALAGVRDIDVFILFPPEVIGNELEDVGMPLVRRIVEELGTPAISKFSQHPYLSTTYKGFDFDIVPAYKLKTPKSEGGHGCPVDRTPFHMRYVKKHLKRPGQVRLLKRFCRGIGIYGADMQHAGFSGYLCELLVIKYGTFAGVVRAVARKWETPVRLTLTRFPKDLKRFEEQDEWMFIDPVDPDRNVASAVCPDCFDTFVAACKAFLKNPSRKFFFPNTPPNLRTLPKHLVLSIFSKIPGGNADVLFSQLARFGRRAEKRLESLGFGNSKASAFVSENILALIVRTESSLLDDTVVHEGPPANAKARFVAAFRKKHSKSKVFTSKAGKLAVRIPRQFRTPESAILDLVVVGDVPKHLRTTCTIISGAQLDEYFKCRAGADLKDFFSRILSKSKSWEW